MIMEMGTKLTKKLGSVPSQLLLGVVLIAVLIIAGCTSGEKTAAPAGDEGTVVVDSGGKTPATTKEPTILKTLTGHTAGQPIAIAWSRDGSKIASAAGSEAFVWDASSGAIIKKLSGTNSLDYSDVSWSFDSRKVSAASNDGKLDVWDISSGALVGSNLKGGGKIAPVWSPNGKKIASTLGQTFFIHDASNEEILLELVSRAPISDIGWSPDSTRLAVAPGLSPMVSDSSVRIYDASTSKEVAALSHPDTSYIKISWSPNGKRIATTSGDNKVRIWDAESGSLVSELTVDDSYDLGEISWSSKGRIAVAGNKINIWDADKGTMLYKLDFFASSLAWSPDGTKLAAGDYSEIKIWKT